MTKTAKRASSRPSVAVLAKRTSYRTFVEERHDPRVVELLAKGDATVRRMRRSHDAHQETLAEVLDALSSLGVDVELHEGPRSRITGKKHRLVVAVGGDGTVLAASHQLGADVPLLGVNSAPGSSVGFFCGAKKGSAKATLGRALSRDLPGVVLTRMRVELNGRVLDNRVLNEALFCHASPAATSRYVLRIVRATRGNEGAAKRGKRTDTVDEEEQKSSGLWIGPAAGSTAAQRSAGGAVLPLESEKIQFVVREPYLGAEAHTRMTVGLVDRDARLELRSKMLHAKLFLDGHHEEHDVSIGDRVVMRASDETLTILGLARNGATSSSRRAPNASRRRRD